MMRHGGNVWEGGGPSGWLDFSANLRPEGPPEWVRRVLLRAVYDARWYPDRQMRAARAGLAAFLGVEPERVLPCAGGAEAIDLALSDGGGRVLVRRDTFGEYAERARVHGRQAVPPDTPPRPGDTLVRCNPNNPTGEALDRGAMLDLLRTAERAGAELVADEAFIGFCPERSVCREAGGSLTVVGSLTKTLCIPGVRLGYLAASPERAERLGRRKLPWSLSAAASAVAAELPEHAEEMRRDAETNAGRRERFAAALRGLGAGPLPSSANFLLVRFGRDMRPAAEALRRRGILVRTCESFGLGDEYWRLAVRTDEENGRLIGELRKCLGS